MALSHQRYHKDTNRVITELRRIPCPLHPRASPQEGAQYPSGRQSASLDLGLQAHAKTPIEDALEGLGRNPVLLWLSDHVRRKEMTRSVVLVPKVDPEGICVESKSTYTFSVLFGR